MIKLFATDLDGTLLSDDHVVSKKDAAALHNLMEQGIVVAISTGRPYDACKFAIQNVDLHKFASKNYIIICNGSSIMEMQSDTKIFDMPIDTSLIELVCGVAKDYDVFPQIYTPTTMHVSNNSKRVQEYAKYTGASYTVTKDFREISEPVSKLLLNGDPKILSEIEAILAPLVAENANMFYSQANYLELVNKKINKGIALSYLCETLGISRDETFAIGDNFNDISMLEWAFVSCCPQNAVQAAKDIATYVTDASNNDSAVAEAIRKYVLI